MSCATVDNWEPVSDDIADDSEMTLTYRKGNSGDNVNDQEHDSIDMESDPDNASKDYDIGKSSAPTDTISFEGDEDMAVSTRDKHDKIYGEDKPSNIMNKKDQFGDSNSNNVDAHSFTDSENSKNLTDKRRQSQLASITSSKSPSHRKSASSLDLSVPLNLKSTPADPHLSDVNSISSTEKVSQNKYTALNSVNSIIGTAEKDSQSNGAKPVNENFQTSAPAPSFFDNMISSLSFKGTGSTGASGTNKAPLNNNSKPSNPPDIITHRRQPSVDNKRGNSKKESSEISESPLQQAEKPKEIFYMPIPSENQPFDPKRFVNEKYLDTPFHYASEDRNNEFHNLFNTIPKDDRLLDDFSCTLSREFLYQGRIYISEAHLCFHSSLLGWIAKVVAPFKDVTYMEKTSTAGLFPNAISIETENGKTQFNGFLSRDAAFTLMKEVWSRALLELGEKGGLKPIASEPSTDNNALLVDSGFNNKNFGNMTRPSEPSSRASFVSENDSIIEDAIRSVDDYTPSYPRRDSDVLTDEYSDSNEENDVGTKADTKVKGYKLKPDSKYDYDGPYCARETNFPFKPEDNKEYVLAEFECKAPPGVVFQLLFSDDNPKFWMNFFQSQDSSNFSDIGPFDKVNDDGHHYREFTYAKGLHFPVGPKSTKCVVEETILHLDYLNYINVVNTTRTPDVPSGGSFSTKTRYLFRWASETSCMLKISFFVDWTAGSWIKSMVESSCKSGQISATKDLVQQIHKYVEDNTEEAMVSVPSFTKKPTSRSKGSSKGSKTSQKRASIDKTITSVPETVNENRTTSTYSSNTVVPLLYVVIGLLLWNLLYQMSIKRDMSKIMNSALFKTFVPEINTLHTFAHSLVDLPAKAKNDNLRESSIRDLWTMLEDTLSTNLTDKLENYRSSDESPRDELVKLLKSLLSEISCS